MKLSSVDVERLAMATWCSGHVKPNLYLLSESKEELSSLRSSCGSGRQGVLSPARQKSLILSHLPAAAAIVACPRTRGAARYPHVSCGPNPSPDASLKVSTYLLAFITTTYVQCLSITVFCNDIFLFFKSLKLYITVFKFILFTNDVINLNNINLLKIFYKILLFLFYAMLI